MVFGRCRGGGRRVVVAGDRRACENRPDCTILRSGFRSRDVQGAWASMMPVIFQGGENLMRRTRTAFLLLSFGLLLFPHLVDPVAAQAPQQKRIAIVVGDGNYEKAP